MITTMKKTAAGLLVAAALASAAIFAGPTFVGAQATAPHTLKLAKCTANMTWEAPADMTVAYYTVSRHITSNDGSQGRIKDWIVPATRLKFGAKIAIDRATEFRVRAWPQGGSFNSVNVGTIRATCTTT